MQKPFIKTGSRLKIYNKIIGGGGESQKLMTSIYKIFFLNVKSKDIEKVIMKKVNKQNIYKN